MLPLRLVPLLKTRPWGVRSLDPWLAMPVGDEPIGEAWFTADETPIDGGGTLGEAIAADPAAMLGGTARGGPCPLLLKFLFTSGRLSVQVHPDDEYARVHHASLGKTEAWHVLAASPGAEIGLGFTRTLDRERAIEAARSGAIEQLVGWRPTSAGDTWMVPAHTVHAIGAGVTIVEVQEASDVTYRLYDYGRPRELHLEHGFAVADLGPYTLENPRVPIGPGRERLAHCPYFTLERWEVADRLQFSPGAPFYHLLVVMGGDGRIGDRRTRAGDAWFIPAASERFVVDLRGGAVFLAYTADVPTSSFTRTVPGVPPGERG